MAVFFDGAGGGGDIKVREAGPGRRHMPVIPAEMKGLPYSQA